MSVKGSHIRKGEDHKRYSSNPFWDNKDKPKDLTPPEPDAKLPTDKQKGEKE